jgi:hypothetical protein
MSSFRGSTAAVVLVMALTACAMTDATSLPQSSGPDKIPRATPSVVTPPTPDQGAGLIPTAPTGPLVEEAAPVKGVDADHEFRLTISVDQGRYGAGQLMDVSATLTYLGPNAGIVVGGSGTGLVGFALERNEQPALRIDPAGTSDCRPYQMRRGVAVAHPFMKTGGFADEDPLAAFYRAYFASPELRLPAGTWTISAVASFLGSADCDGPQHGLNASVTVVVEP